VICGVVTNGNPDETLWQQNNDALNFMMADTKLPSKDRMRIREYFAKSKKLFKRRSYGGLIDDCLSNEMQGDVRYLISQDIFTGVWWLRDLDREFLEDLSVKLGREAYAPREVITATSLAILTHGMAARGSAFMNPGMWWGDIFLTSAKLRDATPVNCLLYCEVARLSRYDLLETAEKHPQVAQPLRLASLQVALKRTITLVALSQKRGRASTQRSSGQASERNVEGNANNRLKLPQEVLPASIVLQTTLAGLSDQPWREVNYAQEADGTKSAVGISSEDSAHGKQPTTMKSLPEILEAPATSRDRVLTRMVYETNEQVQAMRAQLEQVVGILAAQTCAKEEVPDIVRTGFELDRVSPLVSLTTRMTSSLFPKHGRADTTSPAVLVAPVAKPPPPNKWSENRMAA
jgi:hypothetical protein